MVCQKIFHRQAITELLITARQLARSIREQKFNDSISNLMNRIKTTLNMIELYFYFFNSTEVQIVKSY